MATTLNQTCPYMTIHLNAPPDFTELADDCDRVAVILVESVSSTEQRLLTQRLKHQLSLLRPTLNEKIPAHLINDFVVDALPTRIPRFEPDPEQLCDYCLALAQALNEPKLSEDAETALRGLLCELVWFFAEELKAPRWLRTPDGLIPIVN